MSLGLPQRCWRQLEIRCVLWRLVQVQGCVLMESEFLLAELCPIHEASWPAVWRCFFHLDMYLLM